MKNPCTCGADKVYGSNNPFHAQWCDHLKPYDQAISNELAGESIEAAGCELTFEKIQEAIKHGIDNLSAYGKVYWHWDGTEWKLINVDDVEQLD
jgi:hypothetical protein